MEPRSSPQESRYLEPYLNREDIQVDSLRRRRRRRAWSRSRRAATPRPSRWRSSASGSRSSFSFSSRYNATNALAALAAYHALGLPARQARSEGAAQDHAVAPARGGDASSPEDGLLINDCYNANPLSMTAALEHLAERAAGRRKVAVLGDMAELGSGRRRVPPRGRRRRRPRRSRRARRRRPARPRLPRRRARRPDDALGPHRRAGTRPLVRAVLQPGDCVLVKGSRAMGLEVIADAVAVVPPNRPSYGRGPARGRPRRW